MDTSPDTSPFLSPAPPTSPLRAGSRVRIKLSTDPKLLRGVIEALVKKAGVSKREFAARMGIKRESLMTIARRPTANPSMSWLLRLIHAAGADLFVEFD